MRYKIYFILPTLFAGGAERVFSFIVEHFDSKIFEVSLIVIGNKNDSKYDVVNTPVIYLNKKRVLFALFPLINLIKKEKPHMVISSISHLNAMMGIIAQAFVHTVFVGRHSTIDAVAKDFRKQSKGLNLRRIFDIYQYGTTKLDYVICQSEDMKKDFLNNHRFNSKKVIVIHNPITYNQKLNFYNEQVRTGAELKLITVGRLRKIKGHIRILKALSQLQQPFSYTIIGDGDYKNTIFETARNLGLMEKINYIPHSDDVYKLLASHDYFLQGSYSEGFPNALLESCVVGTPVLAFNAPGGTREIIETGINGYILDSENEMIQILRAPYKWNRQVVSQSVYKKFSKNNIIENYQTFILDILKNRR